MNEDSAVSNLSCAMLRAALILPVCAARSLGHAGRFGIANLYNIVNVIR